MAENISWWIFLKDYKEEQKEQNSLDPKVICCKLGIVNLQHYTSVLQRLFLT